MIFVKDKNQIEEPFKTFFEIYKNIRDSSVHYSPLKEKIWYSPLDWLTKAKEFKNLVLESALLFWKACYPSSKGPEYLGNLDSQKHLEIAKKRLEIN